jgi:hypothetical protein
MTFVPPIGAKSKRNQATGEERNKLVIQGWSGERHTESVIQSSIPESTFSASNKESHTQDQIQVLLKAG